LAASATPADIPGAVPQPRYTQPSFADRLLGIPETAASIISGGVSGLAGQFAGVLGGELGKGPNAQLAGRIAEAGTYQPRTQSGQEYLGAIGQATQGLPAFMPMVGQAGTLATSANALAARASPTAQRAVQTVQNALARSPESRQMAGGGAALTDEAIMRAERAQRQGIPLTKGEQLKNLQQQQSEQYLLKSGKPELVVPLSNLKKDQQEAIVRRFQALTEQTGAEMADTDPSYLRVIGEIVDAPLMKEHERGIADYRAKYKAADTSGETLQQVSYQNMVDYINKQTPTTRASLAPILQDTFEQLKLNDPQGTGTVSIRALEDIYQSIGKKSQPGTPNANYGRELKNLIDESSENAGGELYQAARASRRQFAKEFEDVSTVAKLVSSKGADRKVQLSDVFDHVVLDSSKESLQHVSSLLKRAGPEGQQAMNELKGQTIQWLKGKATGVNGITKFDTFKKAVDVLEREDKLTELFGKKGRDEILDLRDTVKDALVKESGAVNYSNTANAVLRGLENVALRIPGAKTVAEIARDRKTKSQAKEAASFNALSQNGSKINNLAP
jgi:hypothetical protein